jgi:hypothetical protein
MKKISEKGDKLGTTGTLAAAGATIAGPIGAVVGATFGYFVSMSDNEKYVPE